jgi:hypothetical protein
MLNFPLALTSEGSRSVGHGVIELYSSLVFSRPAIDPGDSEAYRPLPQYDPQVFAIGHGGASIQGAGTAEQADPFAERLSVWLRREMGRPRKQKRTIKQLHADLVSLGFDGSYGRVAAFARDWHEDYRRQQQMSGKGTYVPLSFAPGEAFQFDWSEDWAIIDGVRTKLQVAHFKLSYSRAFLLRAYRLQTHEMLFDAHNHAFRVLGGVPHRGIYDNMRTAVDKVGRGKVRNVNTRFLTMVSHYLFEAEFCNPAAGWEKGQVEKNVQDARHRLWQPTPQAEMLEALNLWLEERCKALWQDIPHGIEPGSVADAWADEVESLMAVGRPFDGFVEYGKRVSPTCLVHFERNRYSVPASFANRPVSLRVYPDRVLVVAEGQILCEHHRIIDRSHDRPGRTVYDWRHYLAVVQRKPGALRNGAPFLDLPDAFLQLQRHLLRTAGGDREMVEILALVLHHDEDPYPQPAAPADRRKADHDTTGDGAAGAQAGERADGQCGAL